jgi:hypothetical protein
MSGSTHLPAERDRVHLPNLSVLGQPECRLQGAVARSVNIHLFVNEAEEFMDTTAASWTLYQAGMKSFSIIL